MAARRKHTLVVGRPSEDPPGSPSTLEDPPGSPSELEDPPRDSSGIIPGAPPTEIEEDELSVAQSNYSKFSKSPGDEISGPSVIDRTEKAESSVPISIDRSNDPNWSCTRNSQGRAVWTRVNIPPPLPPPIGEAPKTRRSKD